MNTILENLVIPCEAIKEKVELENALYKGMSLLICLGIKECL
jgi:hypothetical protein